MEYEGVKRKEPIFGPDGKPVVKEEYVGRFKQKSIKVCKSTVVNQSLKEADNNKKINDIIRESILAEKKSNPLSTDDKLKNEFRLVYNSLPDVKRNLWNYNNNNIMAEARAGIDQLSRIYLQEYHKKEFEQLRDLIRTQAARYRQSYGKNEKDYEETKMKDLYTRLGNAILKEMREYDRKLLEAVKLLEELAGKGKMNIAQSALGKLYTDPQNVDIYDFQNGEKYLQMAVVGGNKYAAYHLGKLYANERNEHYNPEKAVKYLKQADLKKNKYAQYTLGKLYLAEAENRAEGLKLLERSADVGFVAAQYKLGHIYTDGQSEEFDFEKGVAYLTMAAQEENPYAQLSLGLIYLKGEYCERDIGIAKGWLQKSAENGNEIAEKILDNINQRRSSGEMHPRRQAIRTGATLERTLRTLKRSLKKEWEKEKNYREHEQLVGMGNIEAEK